MSLLSPPHNTKKKQSLDEEALLLAKKQASNLFELGLQMSQTALAFL